MPARLLLVAERAREEMLRERDAALLGDTGRDLNDMAIVLGMIAVILALGLLVDEGQQCHVVEPVPRLRDGESDQQPAVRPVPLRPLRRPHLPRREVLLPRQ